MKDNPHVDIISSKNVYWYLLVDCHTSLVHKQLVLTLVLMALLTLAESTWQGHGGGGGVAASGGSSQLFLSLAFFCNLKF